MNNTVDEGTSPSGSIGDPSSGDQMTRLSEHAQFRQMSEQARVWNDNIQLRQIVEQARAFGGGAQLKQIAEQVKAFGDSAQLKQIVEQARAFGDSAQLKQIAEQARVFGESAQLKQIAEQARVFGESAQLKQIAEQARAFGESAQLKQIVEQAKAFGDSAQLKQIAEKTKAWSNNILLSRFAQQTLPANLTFDVLLGELVARSIKDEGGHGAADRLGQVVASTEGAVSAANLFTVEAYPDASVRPLFSGIPTWLLYLWLICIVPMLTVLANWESIRTGLVDINARIPQTHSFADLRRFISSKLAGKPGDVRLVTGSNVRLRVAPGMKSDVILTLPKYAPVVVLGKEDRTWLYVTYEHEGFLIDGYVSTKFLKKIKK